MAQIIGISNKSAITVWPKFNNVEGFSSVHQKIDKPSIFNSTVALAEWGMKWTRTNLTESDYNVSLLMSYLQRSIDFEQLAGDETTIHFHFTNIKHAPDWWLMVNNKDNRKLE